MPGYPPAVKVCGVGSPPPPRPFPNLGCGLCSLWVVCTQRVAQRGALPPWPVDMNVEGTGFPHNRPSGDEGPCFLVERVMKTSWGDGHASLRLITYFTWGADGV